MEKEGIIKDFETFSKELRKYYNLRNKMRQRKFTSKELEQVADLRRTLVRRSGKYKNLIVEVTGIENVSIFIRNKEYPTDIWSVGLLANPVTRTPTALGYCIDSVGQAVGKLEDDIKMGKRDAQTGGILTKSGTSGLELPEAHITRANWKAIEKEFGITKNGFGRKFSFVSDNFRRKIIFRDVEDAFNLASSGYSKPAVVLAGGVIEELLRLYLKHKGISPVTKNFNGYIKTCEQEGLLKLGNFRLSDSVRYFRNLVHLRRETTNKYSISKATAKGAVSSIFTIANGF